jgi:putative transposase
MTQQLDYNNNRTAVEVLLKNGFDGLAESIRLLFNEAMKIERSEALRASPYERSLERKGYANGFKDKMIKTRVGEIKLDIPQVRGDISFYPHALERGLRSERALNCAICEMYIQGVSTRKVSSILKGLCGSEVSREKVSQCAKELDVELEKWRNRNLDWVRYMVVDARYEKVRVDGLVRDCAVLIAHGVRADGKRTVLGVSVSLSEAEVHWRTFFRSLKERGMYGLELITSDAHSGLKAALKTEFGGILWQRCQFHLQQNAGSYVPKIDMRKPVASDIRKVFNAPDIREAERHLGIVIAKYKKSIPKLADWMEDNLHESFSIFSLPENHRIRMRTSNMAEVINREIKRRTRVIGIFPNEESLLRISSAILREIDERWLEGKVYLKFDSN